MATAEFLMWTSLHLTFMSGHKRQGWNCIRSSQAQAIILHTLTSVLRSQQRVLGNSLPFVPGPSVRPHQLDYKFFEIYW